VFQKSSPSTGGGDSGVSIVLISHLFINADLLTLFYVISMHNFTSLDGLLARHTIKKEQVMTVLNQERQQVR
jgi:hypothetical protein